MTTVTPQSLRDLAERLDATPPQDFVRWRDAEGRSLPYPDYAPIESEWQAAMKASDAFRPSEAYDRILDGDLAPATLETVAAADRALLDGFTTHIARAERFSYGAVGSAHERGLLAAVARRYAELLDTP